MTSKAEDFDYKKIDIIRALKKVGLKSGDSFFTHSNIGFFGRLENCNCIENLYQAFKEAIFEVIGKTGTLVVPTFSYSYCKKEIFDKKTTQSTCGILSEMIRLDKDSLRSDDANFSVCSIGKLAKYFTKNSSEYSFGKNSFWERFISVNGKICNFNFDAGSTFFHYIERTQKVSYRYDKPFYGKSLIENKEIDGVFYHYCRDLSLQNTYPDNVKFDKKMKVLGLVKSVNLGKGQIVLVTSRDTFDIIASELKTNPTFLIQDM